MVIVAVEVERLSAIDHVIVMDIGVIRVGPCRDGDPWDGEKIAVNLCVVRIDSRGGTLARHVVAALHAHAEPCVVFRRPGIGDPVAVDFRAVAAYYMHCGGTLIRSISVNRAAGQFEVVRLGPYHVRATEAHGQGGGAQRIAGDGDVRPDDQNLGPHIDRPKSRYADQTSRVRAACERPVDRAGNISIDRLNDRRTVLD